MMSRISFVVFLALTLAVLTGDQPVNSQAAGKTFNGFELVDKTGNIRKPVGFRDQYELFGSWFVLDPTGNQVHITYASPGAAEYYRKNGKFADGTVMVKEISKTDHAQMTTGDGPFSKPTRPISRWRLTSKKIAYPVTSRPSQPTGSTYKVIRFSSRQSNTTIATA